MITVEVTEPGATFRGVPQSVGTRLNVIRIPPELRGKCRVAVGLNGKEVPPPKEPPRIDQLRAEYQRVTGKKAHPAMKEETLARRIEEAKHGGDDHGE